MIKLPDFRLQNDDVFLESSREEKRQHHQGLYTLPGL